MNHVAARLAEIEARWSRATPGPWQADHNYAMFVGHTHVVALPNKIIQIGRSFQPNAQADTAAIAAAPDDVAWLCAALRTALSGNPQ